MNNFIVDIKDNKIACFYNDNKLKKEEIFNLLNIVDNTNNNKIFLQGKKIIIRNVKENFSLTLNNPIDFVNSDFSYLLENNLDTISNNILEMQKNKHKNKKITKGIALGISSAIAPIVLISTLHSSIDKQSLNTKDFMEPIRHESIDVNKSQVINSKLEKDIVNEDVFKNNDVSIETVEVSNNQEVVDSINNEAKTNTIIKRLEKNAELAVSNNSQNSDILDIHKKFESACEKAGHKWGWSKEILLGLLTQESHGKETNLMQITFSAFKDEVMNVYNYEDNKWVKVVLTNDVDRYKHVDIRITEEELKNPYTNIATAAILLNYSTTKLNTDNIFAIIEYYNKGYGNFQKNMYALEANSDKSVRQVLDNPTDTEVIDYSFVCNQGDPNYVCNVMQYIPNAENGGITFKRIEDGEEKLVTINVNRTLDIDLAKN